MAGRPGVPNGNAVRAQGSHRPRGMKRRRHDPEQSVPALSRTPLTDRATRLTNRATMLLARNTFLMTIADVAESYGVKRSDLLAELDLEPSAIETAGTFVEASIACTMASTPVAAVTWRGRP